MDFTSYFIVYGLIVVALSVLYYWDDRRNEGAVFKLGVTVSSGLLFITVTYASIQFLWMEGAYWLFINKIIFGILFIIQYILVPVIAYGFLKFLYTGRKMNEK